MADAAKHPHNVHRQTIVTAGGVQQPAPAPRFSRTSPELGLLPGHPGQHTREILADWGVTSDRIDALVASGAVK